MTIHPDIARRIAQGMDPQDAYAQAIMSSMSSHKRRQRETPEAITARQGVLEGSRKGGSTMAEKHRRFREQITPEVLEMRRAGANQITIAAQLGVGRHIIARILEEAQ